MSWKLCPSLIATSLLLTACGAEDDANLDAAQAVDPQALAAQVSQPQLETSIQALEALGTRHTIGDGDANARAYLEQRITDLGLAAELDEFTASGEAAHNVIVKHPGTTSPEVVWIFSAHYDSTSNMPATAAPGADDNATGVAAVLEAMRLLTPHRFADSVWFVFTAAEEQGSLGSAHMTEWLLEDGVDVRGVIAPDMMGYWPLGDADLFDILGDPDSEHLVERMAEMATVLGVAHKTFIAHGYCYGDDHTSFQEAGFPAISPMDCVEAHNLPATDEELPHYHRTTDTFDTLYMPFTTKVAGVIVATLADLAQPVAP